MRKNRCCFTGHRPEKIKSGESEVIKMLEREIGEAVYQGITTFITGMARGVDLWAAQIVINLRKTNPNIKLICAIPYKNFSNNWSPVWKSIYNEVIDSSDYVKIFYPIFTHSSFDERNNWMVDHSTHVIAVYNGEKGGTHNTIEYAKGQKDVAIHILLCK